MEYEDFFRRYGELYMDALIGASIAEFRDKDMNEFYCEAGRCSMFQGMCMRMTGHKLTYSIYEYERKIFVEIYLDDKIIDKLCTWRWV